MESQEQICALCGTTMINGKLKLTDGVLYWKSFDKIEHTKDTFFTGREKKVNKKMQYSLMMRGVFMGDEVQACFCPVCRKVFAEFDASIY